MEGKDYKGRGAKRKWIGKGERNTKGKEQSIGYLQTNENGEKKLFITTELFRGRGEIVYCCRTIGTG